MRSPLARQLLAPGQEMLGSRLFWRYQSDGLAVLLNPDLVQSYRLPMEFPELLVVANRFHLKPLLPLLSGDERFYVLALSQNEIRLLQGTRYSVGQVDLEDVPDSLAEALRWDAPESQLQWHTGTGAPSSGQPRAAIFHGHGGSSTPQKKDQILRYFQQLDAGLTDVLAAQQAPLVLAGVEYLLPIYQKANSYPYLVEAGITGNPEEVSDEALHKQALDIVTPILTAARREAVSRYHDLKRGELASNDIAEVVSAASQARIDTLFVALNTQRWGSVQPGSPNGVQLHEPPVPDDEDLLDFAAIQCLLNGGTVYAVAPDDVPGGGVLAAVLRF
ncbi:MAG: hypothetical protein R2844_22135 [Caldilineales bacterium]